LTLGAEYGAHGLPRRAFHGPINAVLARPFTLVAPAQAVAPRLWTYVASVRARFFASAPFQEAKAAALPPTSLVLYGSPTSNPLVAAVLAQAGWRVEAERVVVGEHVFEGPGLVLIACRPHPDDPAEGVLVYTSARDDDLVDVNGVFHGPTDWVVARRLGRGKHEVLGQGSF